MVLNVALCLALLLIRGERRRCGCRCLHRRDTGSERGAVCLERRRVPCGRARCPAALVLDGPCGLDKGEARLKRAEAEIVIFPIWAGVGVGIPWAGVFCYSANE